MGKSVSPGRGAAGCARSRLDADGCGADSVPLAVWPCAQVGGARQRAGRYRLVRAARGELVLPELARRIVGVFSEPGEVVVDPFAGVGVMVAEAAVLGRRAVGLESRPRLFEAARISAGRGVDEYGGAVEVVRADPRRLVDHAGQGVALVATRPPAGVGEELLGEVYAACRAVLRSGGVLAVVTRNAHTSGGGLVDTAGATVRLARGAGFDYLQHIVALTASVRDDGLHPWPVKEHPQEGRRPPDGWPPGPQRSRVVHDDVTVYSKPAHRVPSGGWR